MSGQHLIGERALPEHPDETHQKADLNPLTVNPAIGLDSALSRGPESPEARRRRSRRGGRAVHAARTARAALQRAGL